MPILRAQHALPNSAAWKRGFDGDPIDRKGCGVRRCHVHRSVADPNFVMIDSEFAVLADAESSSRDFGPGGAVMRHPEA